MTDAQTEAWAIPLFVRGSMTDEEYSSLVEKIATALAAKDAELAVLRAELSLSRGSINNLLKLNQRAEAQLAETQEELAVLRANQIAHVEVRAKLTAQFAEARKALEKIANGNHGDLYSVAFHYEEIARRALEAHGGENG